MRILFLNSFLLRVQVGPVTLHRGSFVAERAREISELLAGGDYDLAAFSEAFDEREWAVLRASGDWRAAIGPPSVRWPPAKSSGLYTLSRRHLVATGSHRFSVCGTRLRDVDAWARKGVLMVAVEDLELYSMHLFAGGGLLVGSSPPDRLRLGQLDELLRVIGRWHQPGNAVLIVGDFNIAAGTETGYRLQQRMAAAGFEDMWIRHGRGEQGFTVDLRNPRGPDKRIDYAFFRRSGLVV